MEFKKSLTIFFCASSRELTQVKQVGSRAVHREASVIFFSEIFGFEFLST